MKLLQLAEAYNFDYSGWEHDRRPFMLYLGEYTHPTTKNKLVGGLNLNVLTARQLRRLREFIVNRHKEIGPVPEEQLFGTSLREAARAVRGLFPDVFDRAYRTYDKTKIGDMVSGPFGEYLPGEFSGELLDQHPKIKPDKYHDKKELLPDTDPRVMAFKEPEEPEEVRPEEPEEPARRPQERPPSGPVVPTTQPTAAPPEEKEKLPEKPEGEIGEPHAPPIQSMSDIKPSKPHYSFEVNKLGVGGIDPDEIDKMKPSKSSVTPSGIVIKPTSVQRRLSPKEVGYLDSGNNKSNRFGPK